MQYPNINSLTTLLWNLHLLLWLASLLWEETSVCPLGRSDAVSAVLFSLSVTPTGSLPGHKTERQKKSEEQKCSKVFYFEYFIFKAQTSARPYVQSKRVCTKHRHKMRLLQSWHAAAQTGSPVDLNVLPKIFLMIWSDESYCHITSCFHCFNAPK